MAIIGEAYKSGSLINGNDLMKIFELLDNLN